MPFYTIHNIDRGGKRSYDVQIYYSIIDSKAKEERFNKAVFYSSRNNINFLCKYGLDEED